MTLSVSPATRLDLHQVMRCRCGFTFGDMLYLFYALQILGPLYCFALNGCMLAPMEIVYFTLAAILLYLAADWILRRIETAAGKPLTYRSLIFFVILLTMAVTSFALVRNLTGE